MPASDAEIEAYIRRAARARGVDEEIAVRVARSEGLNNLTNAADGWRSVVGLGTPRHRRK